MSNYHFVAAVTFKKWMQKNIKYNNRWKTEVIKKRILLHLFTICYIINVSNKLRKTLSVISLELTGVLIVLHCISLDMYKPIPNIKSKQMASYLILSLLYEKLDSGAYSPCFYTLLRLRYLPVSLMPIKGLKEYK